MLGNDRALIEQFKKLPDEQKAMLARLQKDIDKTIARYHAGHLTADNLVTIGTCLVKIVEELAMHKQLSSRPKE